MAIFNPGPTPGSWVPLARGPFAGLQGGAVAGLLTGEVEALAASRSWGEAVSLSAWFLKPVPMAPLRSKISVLREGARLAVVDNSLWAEGEDEPCATARITLSQPRPLTGLAPPADLALDPLAAPITLRQAAHGQPWFWHAMEARLGERLAWFRLHDSVVAGAGPMAQLLGPADWAHGITRDRPDDVAIPNPNLTVHLTRPPRGDWIGVEPQTHWRPERGAGLGGGLIYDPFGVIGMVSMAVVMTAVPRPVPTEA